jgi:hypothetical protein
MGIHRNDAIMNMHLRDFRARVPQNHYAAFDELVTGVAVAPPVANPNLAHINTLC